MPHTILLIDDDVLLRQSLAYTLGRAGYVVQTAGTAIDGLALVQQSPPDLVLLDIGLPGLDGLDALQILRREHQIPVILLTARRGKDDESLGLTLGADDYVKKPCDTDVLLARIAAAPTCTASDATSGLAGACSVSGYSNAVGSQTVTASATDNAGNSASASATYTVLAWTLTGFYQPVNMDALNTVKGGSTVPLKFEVFAGDTELTDINVVQSFTTKKVTCGAVNGTEDPVDIVSTGGTSLRYDFTDGQFIQNWKTPKEPGQCYVVTMTTQDGLFLSANFKLK